MGRRILAFFLGVIFGIILVFGTVFAAGYIVLGVQKINQLEPSTDKYLGDLANGTVLDLAQELYNLYIAKAGIADENGHYYSLGEFLGQYNIDTQTAFGITLPDEVLDAPLFEYFQEGGIERAMKQIKVSAVPAIVNMFGSTDEEGNPTGTFGENVVEELSKYSLYDLLSDQEIGISGVFANVKLAEVLAGSFPAEDSDNKLMWAVGQTYIGGLLSGISGSDNITLQLKEGGAFETIGSLPVTTFTGEDQYVSLILKDYTIGDLIGDNGEIRMDDLINGVSIGELLGCQKNEITDVSAYVGIDENASIMQLVTEDDVLYVKSDDGTIWYQCELTCTNDEDNHAHENDCYGYVWYSTSECSPSHAHEGSGDMYKDGKWYPRAEGLYAILSGLSISDLTSGNDNALMDKIKTLKVGEILGDSIQVTGIMKTFVDLTIENLMTDGIDNLYLGAFFSFERKGVDVTEYGATREIFDGDTVRYYLKEDAQGNVALSDNGDNWYEGKLDCNDASHAHNGDCYAFVWYKNDAYADLADGLQGKFANKQIADLANLNDELQKLTLNDVLDDVPSMLKDIADTPIGQMESALNNLYIGGLLGYSRSVANGVDASKCVTLSANKGEAYLVKESDDYYMSVDKETWYKAKLVCSDDHEHASRSCFIFVWYTDETCLAQADGLMSKLSDKRVNELSDLTETIQTFTLNDVLGNNIPDMLKSIADTQIKDLNTAINNMYLGDFLEYNKKAVCGQDHQHVKDCYVWEGKNGEKISGVMAKLASNKVNELGDLGETIKTFTLKDVLGDDIPSMLNDIADTPIGQLNDKIGDLYLGSTMDYHRVIVDDVSGYQPIEGKTNVKTNGSAYIKSDDGEIWYEADSRYEYVWRDQNNVEVSGVTKAFVNCKLNSESINDTMDNLTLSKLGIDTQDNTILEAIKDKNITEIGSSINDMKMGTLLGYTQGENGVWFEDAEKKNEVKGLNGKMANMSVSEIGGGSGISSITATLTIGDLIDSGMMEVSDDNAYKFSIIFCNNTTHQIEGSHNYTTGNAYRCNLAEYLAYSVTKNTTAQSYWEDCHDNGSPTHNSHRDEWKEMPLKEFIEKLLSAIDVNK